MIETKSYKFQSIGTKFLFIFQRLNYPKSKSREINGVFSFSSV